MLNPLRVCCLIGALLSVAPASASVIKDWIEGPARYIAEPHEIDTFKGLDNDDDRSLFISRFWIRRDPTPDTLANEYRQMFWERVREANDLFLDSHLPGWKTDRGKIYVLYGPPNRVEDIPHLRTESSPGSGQGLIRWYYEGRPGGRTDVNPVVIVPFVRQSTGEYRVSYDPKLSSVFFDEVAIREKWDRGYDRFVELYGAPRPTEMSVMLDLGRMQEVPPQAQVLLERVETVETYNTQPIDTVLTRYQHPERDAIVTVITVDVSHVPEDHFPSVIARFRPLDATNEPRMLAEDSFTLEQRDGRRVAQGRLLLGAGDYDLTVLVTDMRTAATGLSRRTFRNPEPADRLRLSDVVWADELESLEYAALASYEEAFIVGPFRVVPRMGETYTQGDTIRLFYEVYGGKPPYRITYRIEGLELDGNWVPLGRPAGTEQSLASQGWALPTSTAWPPGEYRVRVQVDDAGERLTTTLVPFTLQAASP